MAIGRRALNTGPLFMQGGGRTMKDPLGLTGSFRGAPDFGDVQFHGLVGQVSPNGIVSGAGHPLGQYGQFGGYGDAENDPRRKYGSGRLQQEDPRDRSRLEIQMAAEQMAAGGTPMSATQQSIAQLGALGQRPYQTGGRGMPTAARGGFFAGPVRVHAGEVVQPDGNGGVQVIDPITAQSIDQQVAVSDARVNARVEAALAPRREVARQAAQYRDVTGSTPLAAPMGQEAEMDRIMSGSLNPNDASPEVRAGFMERWQTDPRWAKSVRASWDASNAPARTPIEEQRAAGAAFAAEQAARPQAEKDDIAARAAARDERLRASMAGLRARQQADMAMRREALVRDVPLDTVKGEDAQYGIDDVLFERARARRTGDPEGVARRLRSVGIEDQRYALETQRLAAEGNQYDRETRRIAALNTGFNRSDATVEAARMSAMSRILSSPDSTDEDKAMARSAIAAGGGFGGAVPQGAEATPPPIGGAWGSSRNTASQEAAQSVLGLRDSPESQMGWATDIDADLRDLSDIRANRWASDDPNQLASYRQSLDRYLDTVMRASEIQDPEGRAIALDMLNRKAQEFDMGGSDVVAFGAGPLSGSYGRIIKGKREITDAIARLLDGGRLTPAEIGRIRSIYGSRTRQTSEQPVSSGGTNSEM